jgi:hypothetical protein
MQGERPLDTDPEGLLAHREGLARAMALALDDDALEDLGPAPVALDHLEVHAQAVTGVEFRDPAQLGALDSVDDGAHAEKTRGGGRLARGGLW